MRVVLDTNVLLSAIIATTGSPRLLLDAWLVRRFALVSHAIQLDELRDVTRRDKFRGVIRPAQAGRLLNRIARIAEFPDPLPSVSRSPDPRDDYLLALCEAGRVDRLVTGDKNDLLALERHGATRIVTAAVFARELGLTTAP